MQLNWLKIIILTLIVIIIVLIIVKVTNTKGNKRLKYSEEDRQFFLDNFTINVAKYVPSRNSFDFNTNQKIPKRIIQTNHLAKVPINMHKTIQTIIDMNPEYEYTYMDNEDVENFLQFHYGSRVVKAYNDLIPGAYKADLFRYCYLYKYGGVYIDTGMIALRPFRKLIKATDQFIAPEDNGNRSKIYNAFMCCVPGHPILSKAIDICLRNIENKDLCSDPLMITGPGALGKAFHKIVKKRIIPNRNYANGIKIIQHISGATLHKDKNNIVGEINIGGKPFLHTKYPTYHSDRAWYHSVEEYGLLWQKKEIYHSTSKTFAN